nr:hypothetical protein [Tanacetum cinerariifolium]
MASKRTTKSSPAITTTTTTSVTDAQLKVLIDQGIARALTARDADKNTNDDDSHVSGTCARRTERVTRECTYPDFIKCKPLNFKGTEGVTDGEAMINSIQNGDQPLPVITQVSLAGNAQNAPPTLKDPKFWTAEEKKTRKIYHLARSLLI